MSTRAHIVQHGSYQYAAFDMKDTEIALIEINMQYENIQIFQSHFRIL